MPESINQTFEFWVENQIEHMYRDDSSDEDAEKLKNLTPEDKKKIVERLVDNQTILQVIDDEITQEVWAYISENPKEA